MDNEQSAPTNNMTRELTEVVKRIPKYARLSWLVLKDPDLTGKQKAALLGGLGYSISPIDAIPGIIPVIGQLDDLAVVIYAVRWVLRTMPPDRAESYLSKADLTFEILDSDLDIVKRSGKKIVKRAAAAIGISILALWGFGKIAARSLKGKDE